MPARWDGTHSQGPASPSTFWVPYTHTTSPSCPCLPFCPFLPIPLLYTLHTLHHHLPACHPILPTTLPFLPLFYLHVGDACPATYTNHHPRIRVAACIYTLKGRREAFPYHTGHSVWAFRHLHYPTHTTHTTQTYKTGTFLLVCGVCCPNLFSYSKENTIRNHRRRIM